MMLNKMHSGACRRLPVILPPLPEEAFSSWVIRLAAAHGLKTRSLCSILGGKPMEFTGDLNGPAGAKLLLLLADQTRIDPTTLQSWHTLTGFNGRLFVQAKADAMTPWVLPGGSYMQRRPAMQYCPLCLATSPVYFRRIWRLSLFAVCPAHGVGLRHVCPACSAPVDPIMGDMRHCQGTTPLCWQCGFDLRMSSTEQVDASDVCLAVEYHRALHGGSTPAGSPPGITTLEYFTVLGMLCARLLQRKCRLSRWREEAAEKAGATLPTPIARHVSTAFDTLAEATSRQAVLRTANWLLQEWPGRFVDVARATNTRTSDFVSLFVACPAWFLKPLQTLLTPPRRKPTPTPGMERARRKKELILAHRLDWCPSRLHILVRVVRKAGFYSPETDDGTIAGILRRAIPGLREEAKARQKAKTRSVARDTSEWSRLILMAKPYRKAHCSSKAKLRYGIKLLCAEHFLSSRDLSELLHRNQDSLSSHFLTPMLRDGELQTRLARGGAGPRSYRHQAYRTARKHDPA